MMTNPGRRWSALWTSYLLFVSTGVLFFHIPPLLTEIRAEVPMDDFAVGWLQGAYAIPAVLFALIGGIALDRWDTRRAGIFSGLLMLAGSIMFNLGGDYTLMLASRFIIGVGSILINLVAAKMLSIWFREKQMGLAMSVLHTAWPISAIVAYSTFYAAAQVWGWKGTTLAINIFVAATVAIFILWAPRETDKLNSAATGGRIRDVVSLPLDVWLAAGAWFCFTASMASIFTFGAEFFSARGWSYGSGSFITGLLMWAAIPGALTFGWLIDRMGTIKSYIVGPALLTGLCLLLLQSSIYPMPLMLLAGFFANALPIAVYAVPGLLVRPAHLGVAFGIILTFSNLGNTVGPVLIGFVNTLRGEPITGIAIAAIIFAMAAICAVGMGKHRLEAIPNVQKGGAE